MPLSTVTTMIHDCCLLTTLPTRLHLPIPELISDTAFVIRE
jgi:hypothetical protein